MLVFDHTNQSLCEAMGLSESRCDELDKITLEKIRELENGAKSLLIDFVYNGEYTEAEKIWMYLTVGINMQPNE